MAKLSMTDGAPRPLSMRNSIPTPFESHLRFTMVFATYLYCTAGHGIVHRVKTFVFFSVHVVGRGVLWRERESSSTINNRTINNLTVAYAVDRKHRERASLRCERELPCTSHSHSPLDRFSMVDISTVGIGPVPKHSQRWKYLAETFPKTYRSVLEPSWL